MNEVPTVKLDKVTKSFGNVDVLNDVTFQVDPGQVHALLGHNGAGKTTLIRLVLGLLRPNSGKVSLFGRDAWDANEGRTARIDTGVLFESNGLYSDLSALENLEFFARIHRLDLSDWRTKVSALLRNMDLFDRKDQGIAKWSAGMKRKLALIRAIQHEPKLVLLDEPSAGLDIKARTNIRKAIQKICDDRMAIILASQDLFEVQKIATHLTLLKDGKVLFTGSMTKFYQQTNLKRYIGTHQSISEFLRSLPEGLEFVRLQEDPVGASILVQATDKERKLSGVYPGLVETPVDLEDIYIEIENSGHENQSC